MKTWQSMMMAGIFMTALVGASTTAQAGGPVYFQDAYRWRNDDGNETSATWKAAENVPITGVKRDENMRVRFALHGQGLPLLNPRVQYAESTNGPWVAVATDPGTRPFQMATTSWYTNGQPTTRQIAATKSYPFITGNCVEYPNGRCAVPTPGSNTVTEVEYCFQATPYAKRNKTYYFRLGDQDPSVTTNGAFVPFNYPKFACLTIEDTEPVIPTDHIYVDDADVNTARIGDSLRVCLPELEGKPTIYLSSWETACTNVSGAWQGGSRFNSVVASASSRTAFRWIPNVLFASDYRVYARWTWAPLWGTSIPYRIKHSGGTAEVFVNQRDPALAGKWNLLGTYAFNTGTNGYVELSGNDGMACADAIWLERVGGTPDPDGDGDGMPDDWENAYLGGTDAAAGDDADGDGMSNLEEYLAGTVPTDAESVLRITESAIRNPPFDPAQGSQQSEIEIKWQSASDRTYEIEKSTNLAEGFTVTAASGITATPPENTHTVTAGGEGVGFYRVRVE